MLVEWMEYGGFQRCVNSLKRRGKEEACISADRAISTVFLSRFENRDQRRKFRGIVGYSRGKPIQSFKIGGHVHDPAFEILRMYPSFFLFVSQTSRLCNERWQMFHNLWLPYVHDIFYGYDGER